MWSVDPGKILGVNLSANMPCACACVVYHAEEVVGLHFGEAPGGEWGGCEGI